MNFLPEGEQEKINSVNKEKKQLIAFSYLCTSGCPAGWFPTELLAKFIFFIELTNKSKKEIEN